MQNFISNVRRKVHQAKRQKGFTLIELGIVIVIVTVLAALAIPAIRTEIIKGRVTSTGDDSVKAIVALKNIAGTSQNAIPFAGLTGSQVQALFRNSNQKLGTPTATDPSTTHSLGAATGSFKYTIVDTGGGAGSGVILSIHGVNESACTNYATAISKAGDAVSISTSATGAFTAPTYTAPNVSGTSAKPLGGVYTPAAAAGACTAGDTNQINVLVNAA